MELLRTTQYIYMHYNDIVGWLWQADPISGKEWSMSTGLEKYSWMYL